LHAGIMQIIRETTAPCLAPARFPSKIFNLYMALRCDSYDGAITMICDVIVFIFGLGLLHVINFWLANVRIQCSCLLYLKF
jgi:hypothetical protein